MVDHQPTTGPATSHTAPHTGFLLDVVEQVGRAPRHALVAVLLPQGHRDDVDASVTGSADAVVETLRRWCERAGNELVSISGGVAQVRRGRRPDPLADIAPDQVPGTRLWMYTNFDCNLACDYCCVRSSPQTARAALGADRVRQLAGEAIEAGVSELILTGGEPFLLPDIADLVGACTDVLPTTLLTNGMLFKGRRLEALREMDRTRLTLQISLDSPTAEMHDAHRGQGSWDRAVAGIAIAKAEGFRVKVAATLPYELTHIVEPFHAFLERSGIPRRDRVIRALAHRGAAERGVELTVETLIPEVTVTATGVYWHPVGAEHDDQLVTRDIFPLRNAISQVRDQFSAYRADAVAAAQWFPCA
jgi:pyruvate-formate lyase-activating enzyme